MAVTSAPQESTEARTCDLSTVCPLCGTEMIPETSHYRCLGCGYRDSCCM